MSRTVAILTAAVMLLFTGATAVASTDETVVIAERLRPAMLEIEPGTTVSWRNRDDERHRVRSKDGPVRFDSKNLEPGEAFSFTFTVPGTYPYYGHRDRDDDAYFGTVVVSGTASVADATVAQDSAAVTVIDDAFSPTRTTVVTGGTVVWVNRGADEHTVTANDLSFDSGDVLSGARYSMTFDTPGEYAYFCAIHPEMRGTVTVVEPMAEEAVGEDDPIGAEAPAEPVPETSADVPPSFTEPALGSALDALATPAPE